MTIPLLGPRSTDWPNFSCPIDLSAYRFLIPVFASLSYQDRHKWLKVVPATEKRNFDEKFKISKL